MPNILNRGKVKVPAPDTDKLYICLMSYIGETGHKTGDKLSGSHPAVRAKPVLWAREGLDDEQIQALLLERFGPEAVPLKRAETVR
jgi:hypothetical protein